MEATEINNGWTGTIRVRWLVRVVVPHNAFDRADELGTHNLNKNQDYSLRTSVRRSALNRSNSLSATSQ